MRNHEGLLTIVEERWLYEAGTIDAGASWWADTVLGFELLEIAKV